MNIQTHPFLLTGLLTALLLSGCGGDAQSSEAPSPDLATALDAYFTGDPAPAAITVSAARTQAEPGQLITVRGKIAGVDHPFTEGYAQAVLADIDLQTCDLMGDDDHCPTPWDACCVDPDELKTRRLVIQIPDASGAPVAQSLRGVRGLSELSELVATGTVAEQSSADNVIIDIETIYFN